MGARKKETKKEVRVFLAISVQVCIGGMMCVCLVVIGYETVFWIEGVLVHARNKNETTKKKECACVLQI